MIELGCAFSLGVAAGGALVWTCKTRLHAIVVEAGILVTKLSNAANAIASLIRKA
ncbi:hypothetical protein ACQR1W_35285 [Bradyrhizobium sp. HKCCYLS1011]|uniref:hypothetical protein n=1 Tax=Bradyrhizobium sp. HKCCYLS1011 TaxID=3420733 RepID=UPI003EB9E420